MLCVFNDQPVVAWPCPLDPHLFHQYSERMIPLVHWRPAQCQPALLCVWKKYRIHQGSGRWPQGSPITISSGGTSPVPLLTTYIQISKRSKMSFMTIRPMPGSSFSFDENVSYTGQTVDAVGIPFNTSSADFVQFQIRRLHRPVHRYMKDTPFKVRSVTLDASGEQETTTAPLTVKTSLCSMPKPIPLKATTMAARMVEVTGKGDCGQNFISVVSNGRAPGRSYIDDSTHYYLRMARPWVLQPGKYLDCSPATGKQTEVTFS